MLPCKPVAGQSPPSFTDDEVVRALRAVGTKGLRAHPRVQSYLVTLGYDIVDVSELVAECEVGELIDHGLDDKYPERQDYIAVLEIHATGEPLPFYVKIALPLPDLATGMLLSFKLRT